MPNYEYQCPKCSLIIEVYHKLSNYNPDFEQNCLSCDDERMLKIISKPAVHFKVSGFYETDYKGK